MRKFPAKQLKPFPKEFALLKKLNSPGKVQDFLNGIHINFETGGETCRSPLFVLRTKKAHCMEGAMLAAAAFWYHGIGEPLIFDLRTTRSALNESDHVVALFRRHGAWGAVSKTNHAVLRYRDPIYKNLRELALSYFHEYFLDSGVKTLRNYSAAPFNLLRFGDVWLTSAEDLWEIPQMLDDAPHIDILKKDAVRHLRLADPIEIKAGKLVVEEKKKKKI